MGKYINKFKNQEEYESNIFSLDYPNINYIESGDTVVWTREMPPHMVSIQEGSSTYYGGILVPNQSNEITKSIVDGMGYTSNYQVTSITISNGVTSIGDNTFNNSFTEVTTLTIPNTVTSIGDSSFDYVGANAQGIPSLIPSSVTTIGVEAFIGCRLLVSEDLSNITSIGVNAFSYCTNLTAVTLSNNLTIINEGVFKYSSLISISIPSSVTEIGSYAFENCTSLTSVTINATTPPTLGRFRTFDNTNDCPIYVPSESVDAYKAATNWSSYASRIQAIPTE